MKKLVIDTVISSLITCAVSVLLSILAPFLADIIPVDITSSLIAIVSFVFVFIWYRYMRSSEGEKIVHKDYPEKSGVYSLKTDLKIMLKRERNVLALFFILTVVAHVILDIAFYYKSNTLIIQGITLLLFPFGFSNAILHYFRVSGSMLPVAAILLFVVNIILICLLYIIVLSIRRRKWIKEWFSM